MSKGGYLISMKAGGISYVFGSSASEYAQARSEYLLEYMQAKIADVPVTEVPVTNVPVVEVPAEEAPPFSSVESFAPILFGNHTEEPSAQ
jgi:hypothetical protein